MNEIDPTFLKALEVIKNKNYKRDDKVIEFKSPYKVADMLLANGGTKRLNLQKTRCRDLCL